MSEETLTDVKERMEKTIQNLRSEFGKVRGNRANVSIVDSIVVDYYGTATPLKQMAQLSVPEPRQICITPWDKSAIAAIEKAIQQEDIGVSPSNDGGVIRLNLPALTEERRRDLVKVIKKMTEDARVSLRHIRRDSNEEIKTQLKEKLITEDDEKKLLKSIQEQTDQFVKEVEELGLGKEKEIMEV